jgi:hypothetical protein
MEVEPFVHLTVIQVQTLQVANIDKTKKLYFEDFIRTLTDNELIFSKADVLKERLGEFVKEKDAVISKQNIENQNINNKNNLKK